MGAAPSEREASDGRPRLLFIALDSVGPHMAGAGIRYWELAHALATSANVVLAAPSVGQSARRDVELVAFEPHAPTALRPYIRDAQVIVAQPQWPVLARWLRGSGARLVYDLYDPEPLEAIEQFAGRLAAVRRLMLALTLDRLDDALRTGHHFMCASEKQRDLWLGAMLARRLIAPTRYDRDPTLRSLIDVVPFGLPDEPPSPSTSDPIRRAFPAIAPEHEVVLWNGGIWNWLDAPGTVRAFARLARRRPQARLVFMGAADLHAARLATAEAREVAAEEGLLGDRVFFHDRWVPYDERAGWLLRANCAVATHHDHLETRFAFRTRLLDCFWAGLPIVCTSGDELSGLVARRGLGEVVAPEDEDALVVALDRVLEGGRRQHAEALRAVAHEFAWPRVAAPLLRWAVTPQTPPPPPRSPRPAPGHALRSIAYRTTHRQLRTGLGLWRRARSRRP